MATVFVSGSTCPYTYDVIEDLVGKNVTENDAVAWPCELRTVWVEVLPLVNTVRFLLSYGTSTIVIVGVCLNILSFIVLTRKSMRKTTSNLYLAFLAVYDTCSLTFNFMIGVIRGNSETANKSFQDNEALCTFHGVVVELFNLLSVWVIVAFTVERFLMVKFPLKARTWSPRKTVVTLVIVSAVMTLVSFHKIAVSGFEGDSVFGYKACKTRRKIFKEIIYLYVALNTWLPTVLLVTLNLTIVHELRKNRTKRLQMASTSMSKSDERATRLLLVVSSSYVLLVLPLGIIQSTELIWNGSMAVPPGDPEYVSFMSTKIRLKWTRAFFFSFYQLNFAINFFLYVASSSAVRFRASLRKVLRMKPAPEDSMITQTVVKINSVVPSGVDEMPSDCRGVSEGFSGTSKHDTDVETNA
ncbi:somatostatin receptor type 2-like [Mercenaria mercenaria]|uniref:somatostatin receptor type 2-like n=1 Tax=Mercenaria mercenaria TaxID=6596 RepID=UPI00234F7796|nr:somatostatin receptor type 2-like [Mercenaria mercenaria]